MKTNIHNGGQFLRGLGGLIAVLSAGLALAPVAAQSQPRNFRFPPDFSGGTPPSSSSSDSSSKSDSANKDTGPWIPSQGLSSGSSTNLDGGKTNATDLIQLSFQGANIDMVVQWLSQTTGKSVLKHPQVQCQLTITSS